MHSLLGALCTNTDTELDEVFNANPISDEKESRALDGVDPALITAAKFKEINQLRGRNTLTVMDRTALP